MIMKKKKKKEGREKRTNTLNNNNSGTDAYKIIIFITDILKNTRYADT